MRKPTDVYEEIIQETLALADFCKAVDLDVEVKNRLNTFYVYLRKFRNAKIANMHRKGGVIEVKSYIPDTFHLYGGMQYQLQTILRNYDFTGFSDIELSITHISLLCTEMIDALPLFQAA